MTFFLIVLVAIVLLGLYVKYLHTLSTATTKNYAGKNVVITGCSSGIGEKLAFLVSKLGAANLVIAARRTERLETVAKKCKELNPNIKVLTLACDVAKAEDNKKLIEESAKFFNGPIDYLVLNAGVGCVMMFDEVKEGLSEFRAAMETNYWSIVNTFYYALPYLKKQERPSVICVISSLAGKVGTAIRTGYSPTKFAVNGFLEAVRSELNVQHNKSNTKNPIQVTDVCPGFVYTEIHENAFGVKGGQKEISRDMSKFMTAELCAEHIVNAMDKGYFYYYLTWPVAVLMPFREVLPLWLLDFAKNKMAANLKAEKNKHE